MLRTPVQIAADNDLAEALEEIAGRVEQLTISRRDPHAFFEKRSEIAAELRRLARETRAQAQAAQSAVARWGKDADQK